MKVSFIKALAFFVLCLLLYACSRSDISFTEIEGKVYEIGTNSPIANAHVRFEWWDPAVYGETKHHVDSGRSDPLGNYKLSGNVPEDQEYYVIAKAPQYFLTEHTEVMKTNVRRGVNQTVHLDLIPYAWIRMHISSTGGFNRMSINPIDGASEGHQFRAGSDTSLISAPVLGNRAVEINMFKYKWGLQETEQVWVQTIGHDTVDVYLSF